ncbi:MAG: T-complex-associated testis-expressed protein 1 [Marteilia pararefringens]
MHDKASSSWKTLALKRSIETQIEKFVPALTDDSHLLALLNFAEQNRSYCDSFSELVINQLLPPVFYPPDLLTLSIASPTKRSDEQIAHLSLNAIFQHLNWLQSVHISLGFGAASNVGMNYGGDKMVCLEMEEWNDVFSGLASLSDLKLLSVSSSAIKDDHLEMMCENLRKNNVKIECLIAKNNSITLQVDEICDSLWIFRNLQHLDLSGNLLGDRGATILSELISQNSATKIRHLVLDENDIGDKGASKVLMASGQLECLALQMNRISAKIQNELCSIICDKQNCLKFIYLAGNDLGAECMAEVAKVLGENKERARRFLRFDLTLCNGKTDSCNQIAEIIQNNQIHNANRDEDTKENKPELALIDR